MAPFSLIFDDRSGHVNVNITISSVIKNIGLVLYNYCDYLCCDLSLFCFVFTLLNQNFVVEDERC